MYNILLSLLAGLLVFGLVAAWLGPVAGVVPALIVWGLALFGLTRRMGRILEGELAAVVPMLQERKISAAQTHLVGVKAKYARWQLLLSGQIDAQLGMIDYLQMKWDDALPKLERGKFRNWTALVCIGAIHYRQGRREQAWEALERAAKSAPKEAIVYVVWAVLRTRSGDRGEALAALKRGLGVLPDSALLQNLQKTIANKRKIKVDRFPEVWYQFFPEEFASKMMTRGRRGGPQLPGQPPQPRFGGRSAPRR